MRAASAILAVALGTALLPTAGVTAATTAERISVGTDQIIVKLKAGKADRSASVAAKHGATVKKSLGSDWKVLKVPAGQAGEVLAELKADESVEHAELDAIMTANAVPNDPAYSSQWHLPKINAPQAWDYTKGSTSSKIAIIDTGVDLDHPDLVAKIVPGYDFVNGDSIADDDNGHGTHVAGIAAASTNNSIDGAGVDWNAKIMPIKVLNAAGSGYTSDIISGVNWAVTNGAQIISLSLGGSSASTAFQTAIDNAWSAGAFIVAAAGGSASTTKNYPAAYNHVFSVAATDSADNKASFTTYGTWVDIAAPGTSILSTKMGGGMTTMSGASMSTPMVAGAAGLVRAANPGISNAGIESKLCAGADPIVGTGTYWQCGRLNVRNSL